MPRPTARVLALLELLQSTSRTRTVAELADRLGVDERTVRRYVSHLVDLDIPVRSVRGRYGGIGLAPSYRMPPLMLTDEEALAVLLGLLTARRAGLVAASPGVVDSATAKLQRVLPVAVMNRLNALLTTADAADLAGPASSPHAPQSAVLLVLAQAVRERRAVALTYTAATRNTTASPDQDTPRTVHPYGLVVRCGHWYLSAADVARGELRIFRVDRVDAVDVLVDDFQLPQGFDAGEQVSSALARVPWRHKVSLRVHTTLEQAPSLFPAGLVTVEVAPAEQGWVRVGMRVERLDWVPALLAGLPVPFIVEAPDALRDLVHSLVGRLSAAVEQLDSKSPPPGR